jgi:putative hemolysin
MNIPTDRCVTLALAATLLAFVVAGCAENPSNDAPGIPAGLPNPASEYCVDEGGELAIRTDDSGGEVGVCIFDDGSECEEWAYYRGECEPGNGTS